LSYPAPHLQVTEHPADERTQVLAVSGEIHALTAPELNQHLTDTIAAGKTNVVIDLDRLEFIDSTGLGVLLTALRRIHRKQGHMTLVCRNPTVLRLFVVTRLDATFEIVPTRDEALERVRG
jgi:anti-sigma B factor antagonist